MAAHCITRQRVALRTALTFKLLVAAAVPITLRESRRVLWPQSHEGRKPT